ncbi:hypothetical protein Tco_0918034 [Tanacetum coccineum]
MKKLQGCLSMNMISIQARLIADKILAKSFKRMRKRKFTSKDDEELRFCLTIVSDEDKKVDYEILDKKYPIIEWRSEYLTTKLQYDKTEDIEDVYLNVVIRKNKYSFDNANAVKMLELKLETEEEVYSFELIRFVKKQMPRVRPQRF